MLTDKQYEAIAPLLPQKTRPPKYSSRQVLNAVLYVLSSGCAWRQLPREYGHWHTIYTRFKRWSESGVLDRVMEELQKQQIIRVNVVYLDSTVVRAHQSASGARKKRGLNPSEDRKADSQQRST